MTIIVSISSLIAFAISTTILGIDASEAVIPLVLLPSLAMAYELRNK